MKSFPVYEIEKFQMSLKIEDNSIESVLTKVSLVSLYFNSDEEVMPFGQSDIKIMFKGKTFNLSGDCTKSVPLNDKFENKISLLFDNKEDFKQWVLFIKVVHKTKLKKLYQNSL